MHKAAQVMAVQGVPTGYDGWLALPGVGPYTAAAVASLAYGEARAVLDGNVRRVLSRLYAVSQPTDPWAQQMADALLDPSKPGDWNEAVMDLGATVCIPKAPRCGGCPLSAHCAAFATGQPGRYPAPKVRLLVKQIRGVALLIGTHERLYLERRGGTLLGGLWGLPLEEVTGEDERAALERLERRLAVNGAEPLGTVAHTMTHRQLSVSLYQAEGGLPLTPAAQRPLSRLDHKLLALAAERLTQPALF